MDVDKKTIYQHIIAVHTHYCGNLRKGEYQFIFGGNISFKLDTGFLVPQSGRIKNIQLKISHEGKTSLRNMLISGSIFTIVAIKDTGEVSNLLTYEYTLGQNDPHDPIYIKRCSFDRDPKNIPFSEGDVINIRTEKD